MTFVRDLPRRLRSLFGTLTFLALAIAAVGFGATWVIRVGLERDALAQAGKIAASVLEPALTTDDVQHPMTGRRYTEIRRLVADKVTGNGVNSVEIWRADGTVVFALRRALIGKAPAPMRAIVRDTLERGSLSIVEGDTFRALVAVRPSADIGAVVELDRSYAAMTASASRWRPWTDRGIAVAIACFLIYLLCVGASLVEQRTRAKPAIDLPEHLRRSDGPRRRRSDADAEPIAPVAAPEPDSHVTVRRRPSTADEPSADAPAYVQPGFREHLEARREAENALGSIQQALASSEQERARLQERLRAAEAELEQARRRLTDLGATAGR
jgi:hypothetical protein